MRSLLPLLALLLASCTDRHEGGFETTDLHARVLRPDGTPVAAARVWLVRSLGDSSPAVVLDSGFSDGSGSIRFSIPVHGQEGLGLDSRQGDSLGLAPSAFARTDTALVVLGRPHTIRIPANSFGAADCYVPGSHFTSRLDADGRTARLDLPAGTWNLAVRRGGALSLSSLHLAQDTVLATDSGNWMDTSAPAQVGVHAARTQALSLEGLDIDIVNSDAATFDSLSIRFFMDGTSADLEDFAVRLDLAQMYSSDGFSRPSGIEASGWTQIVPVPLTSSCPASSVCTWFVDLPLPGPTLAPGERLHLSMFFDRHVRSGESLQYASARPTHDPFSGSDWSFRPRVWADSTNPIAGMPDYGGVPVASGTDLPAAAPYFVLRRNSRWLSGRAPSFRL